jgi:hypothetical protein
MMMLALLAAVATPAPVPTAAEAPIVVIGRKLQAWRGRLTKSGGDYRCRTVKSTGDAAIDGLGCHALSTCMIPIQPQMEAILADKQDQRARQQRLQVLLDAQIPCMKSTRADLIAELANARAGA